MKKVNEMQKKLQEPLHWLNQYPDIVKIIAVGNEAMVNWATSYYVQPCYFKMGKSFTRIKEKRKLPKIYGLQVLMILHLGEVEIQVTIRRFREALIKAVDYVSMHTYPYA